MSTQSIGGIWYYSVKAPATFQKLRLEPIDRPAIDSCDRTNPFALAVAQLDRKLQAA